jgi:hypothetical protein
MEKEEKRSLTPNPSPKGEGSGKPNNGTADHSVIQSPSTTKYPYRLPGTMRVLSPNLDLEFRVTQPTGESNRDELASTKQAQLYKTKGEKKQTIVAHLTAPADSTDPVAAMYAQLGKLAKDANLETKAAPPLRGEKLHDRDGLRVILNKAQGKVEVAFTIDLGVNPDYNNVFYRTVSDITRCFSINQQKLLSAIPARQKSSQS